MFAETKLLTTFTDPLLAILVGKYQKIQSIKKNLKYRNYHFGVPQIQHMSCNYYFLFVGHFSDDRFYKTR